MISADDFSELDVTLTINGPPSLACPPSPMRVTCHLTPFLTSSILQR
jgi:hypothetical protein